MAATGRSQMSNQIATRSPRALGRIVRRERFAPARAFGEGRAHLAEQGYAAELAHAERVHGPARAAPAPERARAAREMTSTETRSTPIPDAHAPAAQSPAHAPAAQSPAPAPNSDRRRWIALAVLCLGQL